MTTVPMRYPRDIFTEDGEGQIHLGHGLDLAVIRSEWEYAHGYDPGEVRLNECHLWFQRRVKNCGSHGDACEMEGEWHGHWHAAHPSADGSTAFTIAHPAAPVPGLPAVGEGEQ